jgi:hypothetical protein
MKICCNISTNRLNYRTSKILLAGQCLTIPAIPLQELPQIR